MITLLALIIFVPMVVILLFIYIVICNMDSGKMELANNMIMAIIEGVIILAVCVACTKSMLS